VIAAAIAIASSAPPALHHLHSTSDDANNSSPLAVTGTEARPRPFCLAYLLLRILPSTPLSLAVTGCNPSQHLYGGRHLYSFPLALLELPGP
jgi:hypothetical protein